MISLYENIFKRKSTRKYHMSPLDDKILADIKAFAESLIPLFPEINTSYEITNDAKNLLPIKAPYYFMLSSEQTGDYLQNIGFIWQQMDLYLSSIGLGSCWLGMARPKNEIKTVDESRYPFVISLCFGKPQDSPHRDISEFRRKLLSEISSGIDDRVEAARLAPCAVNSQNWFFDCVKGSIDVYQKKLTPAMSLIYNKMNKIDMGIAICHLYFATIHKENKFIFEKQPEKQKKGYIYLGTVI